VKDFEVIGDITDVETIATGRGIRELARLRRLYGKGRWRKDEGERSHPTSKRPDANCRITLRMTRTVSVRKRSSVSGTSTSRRSRRTNRPRFVVCVRNEGYEVSLERNKIYTIVPDRDAEREGDLRIVDESCEDYLFTADRFVAIEVPARVKASLRSPAEG
jgi:hypothetical protein